MPETLPYRREEEKPMTPGRRWAEALSHAIVWSLPSFALFVGPVVGLRRPGRRFLLEVVAIGLLISLALVKWSRLRVAAWCALCFYAVVTIALLAAAWLL